ncbi:hypothetical protein [Gilvimarinus algae]|uniref:MacB-like periplasmic core domain-containing protein n=1 Tax=Gilvimarinus algae TaxID=3058037 RepID=A0ABT8TBW3_9GAMM|nr:hypothetical protein [Gilvimarinus sp. SDUM040014]MDO3381589.1 hypothetical protein [Gilvimarinus sp. SDUM040014]
MKKKLKTAIRYLELDRLHKSTIILIIFFISVMAAFTVLFIMAVVGKVSEDAKYSILVESESYTYYPSNNNASGVLLKAYKLSEHCGDSFSEWAESESVLVFDPGSTVSITRFGSSDIRIDVQGENFSKSGGKLNDSPLGVCTSFVLSLNETNSVFTMNLYGDIKIGRNVSDASDAYFPLLLSGHVVIQERSILTESEFQHTPIDLQRGDLVTMSGQDRPARGILRATKDESGLEGVVVVEGGEVFAQSYRSAARNIKISFLNRLSDDNELAISLSALFLLAQFFGVIITFLLRLKVINLAE